MRKFLAWINKERKLYIIFDIIFLLLLSCYLLIGYKKVPFHGDEATLISISKDYCYIFQEHNLDKVQYHSIGSEAQLVRITTGSIYPFTVWMAWHLAGFKEKSLNGFWMWFPEDYQQPIKTNMWNLNIKRQNFPNEVILNIARILSIIFTIISLIIIFLITNKITQSRLASWIASFVYITSPSVLINGRRALQEGAMLCFTALIIYITISMSFS